MTTWRLLSEPANCQRGCHDRACGFWQSANARERNGRKHAAFVVGHHILRIAYHLLSENTTYRELSPTYFEQRRVEQLKRRSLDQLQRLGFQVTLTPLTTAA